MKKLPYKKYIGVDNVEKELAITGFFFAIAFIAHSVLMMQFEGLTPIKAIWVSIVTVTTVGYGDLSAATVPGMITSASFMIYAIYSFTELFSLNSERRDLIKEKKRTGTWEKWKMNNHILIFGGPEENSVFYFHRLIKEIRNGELAECPIMICGSGELHPTLTDLGAVPCAFDIDDDKFFDVVNIKESRACIIAQPSTVSNTQNHQDSYNYHIITRIRELNPDVFIVAECNKDMNRKRLSFAGANSVVRPIRAYPEMLVQSILCPGSEQILENLFTVEGSHIKRYDFPEAIPELFWPDTVRECLIEEVGTPIGYITGDGNLVFNPTVFHIEDLASLMVLNNDETETSTESLFELLS